MATLFPITRARRYIYKYTPPWYSPIDGQVHAIGHDVYLEDQDDLMVRPIGRDYRGQEYTMETTVELTALAHSSQLKAIALELKSLRA